ncbi:MAG: DedA family protein [Chloroflexi bacterium]|nr:DedA family protein [Chloroflexota bacterium]
MHLPFVHEIFQLVQQHQYLGLFLLLLLEESGIPLPLPGDGIMMFAGYQAAAGQLNFLAAFVLMETGTLIGTSILRWVARWGSRSILQRYGRYIHLEQRHLDKAEYWLAERGPVVILLGRLIPGLRIPTSLACGILEVPYRIFLPFVGLGSALYILLFMMLGLVLGRETPRIVRIFWLHPLVWSLLALALLALLVLVALAVWLRRRASGNK